MGGGSDSDHYLRTRARTSPAARFQLWPDAEPYRTFSGASGKSGHVAFGLRLRFRPARQWFPVPVVAPGDCRPAGAAPLGPLGSGLGLFGFVLLAFSRSPGPAFLDDSSP